MNDSKYSIVFENEEIVVVNKRAGIAVIPGRGIEETATLIRCLEKNFGTKLYVVHRLDKETSGIIIFARDSCTHRELSLQFEHRQTQKSYLALVQGKVEAPGVIKKKIYQFGSGRMGVDERGKESETFYRVIKVYKSGVTLLEIVPVTGRRHQIRVHLYSVGYPIIGDPLYGDPRPVGGISRLMLHAHSIKIRVPRLGIESFCAPVDEEWKRILDTFS